MTNESTYELLVGLDVTDDETYGRYRAGMTPILAEYGGSFRYDFTIGEVLKSETSDPINRLFILTFSSERAKDGFFADERYLAVRAEFFDGSVASVTSVAEYGRVASD